MRSILSERGWQRTGTTRNENTRWRRPGSLNFRRGRRSRALRRRSRASLLSFDAPLRAIRSASPSTTGSGRVNIANHRHPKQGSHARSRRPMARCCSTFPRTGLTSPFSTRLFSLLARARWRSSAIACLPATRSILPRAAPSSTLPSGIAAIVPFSSRASMSCRMLTRSGARFFVPLG